MAAYVPLNPRPFLQQLINEDVLVRLKWNKTEYKGKLVSVDSYMNILLSGTQEFCEGEDKGTLGQVLIRCNNVLWISAANAANERVDAMTGRSLKAVKKGEVKIEASEN